MYTDLTVTVVLTLSKHQTWGTALSPSYTRGTVCQDKINRDKLLPVVQVFSQFLFYVAERGIGLVAWPGLGIVRLDFNTLCFI